MRIVDRSRRHFLRSSLALAGLGLAGGCSRLSFPPAMDTAPHQTRVTRPRIGVLWVGVAGPAFGSFRQALRDRGYADPADIIIESRFYPAEREDLLPDLAAELVRLPVDLIVAAGPAAIEAARRTTETIPIVMQGGAAATETGLVASLARPGGNLTGESVPPSLGGKRLELVHQAIVGAARIGMVWIPSAEGRFTVLNAQQAAEMLGVELQIVDLRSADELEHAFQSLAAWHADAAVIHESASFAFHRSRIARLAFTHHLPTMCGGREFVLDGNLMAYGPNMLDRFRRTAAYVDKIIKGAKPAELPVELPTLFDFVLNLKAAQSLGRTIPQSVLQQATEVIQ